MNIQTMTDILTEANRPKIVVAGDFCLDKYIYVDAERDEPSVETGLTAYQVGEKRLYPGAAGTITANLLALGARVSCVGIVGNDGEGFELMRLLEEAGADTDGMVVRSDRATCTYMKPMRLKDGKAVEMNRFDFKNFSLTPVEAQVEFVENVKRELRSADAVIVCDQFAEANFSAVTEYVREELAELAERYEDIIFYADSRAFIDKFRNMIIKCNHKELASIFGKDEKDMAPDVIFECAKKLMDYTAHPVFVTAAERGCFVYDGTKHAVPAFEVSGEIDVVGAGDACNAGIVFSLAKGLSVSEAALVGNAASSLVLKQIGVTGTADINDVVEVLETSL